VWRDATLGGGVKGKLASLVVGDDPGHLLRVRRGLPIWGGSRVPGDLVKMVPILAGGDRKADAGALIGYFVPRDKIAPFNPDVLDGVRAADTGFRC
jgi:hypothetical protein